MGLFSAVIDRSPIDRFGGNATAQSLLQQSQVATTRSEQLWDPNSIRNQLQQQQLMQNMHDLQAGQSLQASRLAAKTGGAGLATAAALNTGAGRIGQQVSQASIQAQSNATQLAGTFSSQAGQFTSQAGSLKNQLNQLYRQQKQANQQARQDSKMARADAIMGVIGAVAGPGLGAIGEKISGAISPPVADTVFDIEETTSKYETFSVGDAIKSFMPTFADYKLQSMNNEIPTIENQPITTVTPFVPQPEPVVEKEETTYDSQYDLPPIETDLELNPYRHYDQAVNTSNILAGNVQSLGGSQPNLNYGNYGGSTEINNLLNYINRGNDTSNLGNQINDINQGDSSYQYKQLNPSLFYNQMQDNQSLFPINNGLRNQRSNSPFSFTNYLNR